MYCVIAVIITILEGEKLSKDETSIIARLHPEKGLHSIIIVV